jgi:hypothetical protein
VWHAVRDAFVAQMSNGGARPAYTRFAASTIAEVGTAHWTGQRIGGGWLTQALGEDALDQIETNLLDEFTPDLRRIGKALQRGLVAKKHAGKKQPEQKSFHQAVDGVSLSGETGSAKEKLRRASSSSVPAVEISY